MQDSSRKGAVVGLVWPFVLPETFIRKTYANNMESSKPQPSGEEDQAPKKSTATQIVYAVIIGLITFYFISVILGDGSSSSAETSQTPTPEAESATTKTATAPQEDMLQLISQSCAKEHGYAIVSGQVKNISDKPLENVEVVVSALAEDGTQITTDTALIEYNPVLSGQTSPFTAYMTYNPAMTRCGVVSFKELLGGTISTRMD